VLEALCFVSAELERGVEWTEGDNGCEKEHCAKHHKNDPERAGHDTAKIQVGEQGSEHHTGDTVNIGHVAFHEKSPLVMPTL